jgi:hypothetical protein
MKAKTKNQIYLVFMLVIGGAFGFLMSSSSIKRPDHLTFNPSIYYHYDIIFGVIALTTIILTAWSAIGLWKLAAIQESPHNQSEEGPTAREVAVAGLIKISAYNLITGFLWIALGFAYMASNEARGTDNEIFLLTNLISACVFLIVGTYLQIIIFRHYNKLYPDRTINVQSPHADRELFNKLDEAERFIVYRSSHNSLKAVNKLIICGVLVFIAYSFFFEFTPLPIIVLVIISIVQKAVYFHEASKLSG